MTVLTLTTENDRISASPLVVPLGNASPKPAYGLGWEEVARPGQPGFLVNRGTDLIRQAVKFRLDGFATGQSVQPIFDALMAVAKPRGRAGETVTLVGPVFHTDLEWKIESIDWSDDSSRKRGELWRIDADVVFVQAEDPDVLERPVTVKPKNRTYTFKAGDTLHKIAEKKLGSSKRWKEIYELNRKKIQRAKKGLKPGTVLTLPPK